MRFCSIQGCDFPVFSTDRNTKKGYCKFHANKYRTDLDKRSIVAKAMAKNQKSKIRSLVDNDNADAKFQAELNKWYDYVATIIEANPHCWECGAYISKKDYRNATAHIMQKSLFKSVATHPLNFLVLGARCSCHEKSHTLEKFSKLKTFPMALQRFKKFENQITETHKLLNSMRDYAKENKM